MAYVVLMYSLRGGYEIHSMLPLQTEINQNLSCITT